MELGLIALAAAIVIAALLLAFLRPKPAALPPDTRLDGVIAAQGEISGQFRATLAAQAELQAAMGTRLDALNQRLSESLAQSATKTAETLGGIQTRLTVIDEAQKNISALSGQVVSLQQVLSNKQARGAFGQAQMEEIVRDGLPSFLSCSRSITITRLGTPIWTAASPMPSAAYMESAMSSASLRISASTFSTGVDTVFRPGSGAVRMGRTAMRLR